MFFSAFSTIIVLSANPAQAEEFEWRGVQLQGSLSAELALNDIVGVRGQVAGFHAPQTDQSIMFFYTGPTFTPHKGDGFSAWISTQLVGAVGWFPGQVALGPSLLAAMQLLDGKLKFFAEVDLVVGVQDGSVSYYGYYAADGCPNEFWNFGAQVEQVDENVMLGPHVGLTLGVAHLEAQYYLSLEAHVFRLAAGLNF